MFGGLRKLSFDCVTLLLCGLQPYPDSDPQRCCEHCKRDERCWAFTLVQGRCYLKNARGGPEASVQPEKLTPSTELPVHGGTNLVFRAALSNPKYLRGASAGRMTTSRGSQPLLPAATIAALATQQGVGSSVNTEHASRSVTGHIAGLSLSSSLDSRP